jgi:branched-chain amino acid transport system ATP-binding protein
MLEIANVTVHYGRVAAIRDVSLSVAAGEIVALIGPNGAGKTTTLNTVMGVLSPSSGEVRFEGAALAGQKPEAIIRRGLALVPEGRQIFTTLSVAENLQLGATVRNDKAAVAADLERVFERFPVLKTYYHSSAAGLSGGEQQQLAIARALLSRPRLLLLDEPSLGLAPQVIDLVFDILDDLRADGTTILLVEQNAERAVELADRAYIMRTGAISFSGTREELLETADFAAAYLGG